jgi:hypothetical protein
MINNIWRDIIGYEGYYQISLIGEIRKTKTGRLLKYQIDKQGYWRVILCKNYNIKSFLVHRLIGIHFIFNDDIDNKTMINHKDGNKLNNSIDNLEWVTRSGNIRHAYDHGLMDMGYKPVYKLDKYTGIILKRYESISEAANDVVVSPSSISSALKGRYKTAKGFIWKYA